MDLKLEDFLPFYIPENLEKYSSIETKQDNLYKKKEENELYNNIILKKEFNELKLEPSENLKKDYLNRNLPLNHQRFMARFLSPYTPYNRMLIFHEVGTGKSCLLSNIAELSRYFNQKDRNDYQLIKEMDNMKQSKKKIYKQMNTTKGVLDKEYELNQRREITDKALVLIKGEHLEKNLIKEISHKCFPHIYKNRDEKSETSDVRDSYLMTRNVRKNYEINSFIKFAKEIKKSTNEAIRYNYSNRYIFIDEAHHLRSKELMKESGDLDVYNEIFRFLHNVDNCKIILLTATPMRDKPTEICSLMNLLLPIDNQIDESIYFQNNKLIEDPIKLKSFYQFFYNKVSYVRQMSNKLFVNYKGDVSTNMKKIKTTQLSMDKNQSDNYIINFSLESKSYKSYEEPEDYDSYEDESVLNLDEDIKESTVLQEKTKKKDQESKKSPLYRNSINSSLFSYPPYIGNTKMIIKNKYYNINEEFKKYMLNEGTNIERILNKIKKHSIKYEFVLRDILKNNNQKQFIYCNVVLSGNVGAPLIGELLSLLNYKHISLDNLDKETFFKENKKENRYAVLISSQTMDKSIISKIIDIFNDPRNIYGEYLKVIIGSNIIGEGISFYHVRQFYLLTPFWNNTETEQAIGRVLRTFSHDQLKPEERTLDIYRLAAIPSNTTSREVNENNSIDLLMYLRSEDKDINIKKIERIMKQSSVDCYLNRMRNILKEEDGSKSCDYTVCNYDCFNVSEDIKELEKENIIYDTYNLFYADDIIFKIKDIIKDLFRIKSSYDFQELFNYLNNLDIEPVLLLRGLKDIIYNNIPIKNYIGIDCYLREDRNIYFLTDDPRITCKFTYFYYTSNPSLNKNITFNEYILRENYKNIDKTLKFIIDNFETIESKNNIDKIMNILDDNILDNLIRKYYIDNMIQYDMNPFKRWFVDKYIDYVIEIKDTETENIYYISYFLFIKTENFNELYYLNKKDINDINKLKQNICISADEKTRDNLFLWKKILEDEENDKDDKSSNIIKDDNSILKRESKYIKKLFKKYLKNLKDNLTEKNPYGYYGKIDENEEFRFVKYEPKITKVGKLSKAVPSGLVCGTGPKSSIDNLISLYLLFININKKLYEEGKIQKLVYPKPYLDIQKENDFYNNYMLRLTENNYENFIKLYIDKLNKKELQKCNLYHEKQIELLNLKNQIDIRRNYAFCIKKFIMIKILIKIRYLNYDENSIELKNYIDELLDNKNYEVLEFEYIKSQIIKNTDLLNKLQDEKFISTVKSYNINFDLNTFNNIDDIGFLTLIFLIFKYNTSYSLCKGMKIWFTKVGYITRFDI